MYWNNLIYCYLHTFVDLYSFCFKNVKENSILKVVFCLNTCMCYMRVVCSVCGQPKIYQFKLCNGFYGMFDFLNFLNMDLRICIYVAFLGDKNVLF